MHCRGSSRKAQNTSEWRSPHHCVMQQDLGHAWVMAVNSHSIRGALCNGGPSGCEVVRPQHASLVVCLSLSTSLYDRHSRSPWHVHHRDRSERPRRSKARRGASTATATAAPKLLCRTTQAMPFTPFCNVLMRTLCLVGRHRREEKESIYERHPKTSAHALRCENVCVYLWY